MNRAERRKRGIRQEAPKMKHMTEKDYELALDNAYRTGWNKAYDKASDIAVGFMFGIPLLVLQRNFKEVMRKEVDGVSRIEHFFDMCDQVYEDYRYREQDSALVAMLNDLEQETGFSITEKIFKLKEK